MAIRDRMCIPVLVNVLFHFDIFSFVVLMPLDPALYKNCGVSLILPGDLNSNHKLLSLKSLGKLPGLQ